jgi:hypothetical protein
MTKLASFQVCLNSISSDIYVFTSTYKQTKYIWDWETSQKAYINLALIILQLRGVRKFDA